MKSGFEELITAARAARRNAYAPYSRYAVGAAVRTKSGKVYSGCNVENAVYPTGVCAERVAIFKAISEGERRLVALAVVTSNAGSPCGSCRQVFSEFAGGDAVIVIATTRGNWQKKFTLEQFLPLRFGPEHLSG
jgi:cytidine deaminase